MVHEEQHAGCRIEIHQDDDPLNPITEWDMLGKFVCFHNRYTLGNCDDFTTPEDALEYFESTPGLMYWPLYLMDHSGLSISIGSGVFRACDPQGWDWGQIGWVFVERETAVKEFGKKILTQKVRDKVLKCIQAEVNLYDQYLRGDVYGYVVGDAHGEHDSCWGFFGYEDCIAEAKSIAEGIRNHKLKQHIERVK